MWKHFKTWISYDDDLLDLGEGSLTIFISLLVTFMVNMVLS